MAGRPGASPPSEAPHEGNAPASSPRVLQLLPLATNAFTSSLDTLFNLSIERAFRQQLQQASLPSVQSVPSSLELAGAGDRASPVPAAIDNRSLDLSGEAQRRAHSRNPSRDVRAELPPGRHSRNASRETHEPMAAMQQLLAAGAHHVRQLSRDSYASSIDVGSLRHSREDNDMAAVLPAANQDDRRDIEQGADAAADAAPPDPPVPHQEALSINVSEVLLWLDSSWPFLALLAFLFLYVHRNGILLFIWQMVLLIQLNNVIVRQVAIREARKVTTLLGVCAVLSFNIFATYFFLKEHHIWRSFLFQSPKRTEFSIWYGFWIICVNDVMTRYLEMSFKAVLTCVYYSGNPKKRAQVYAFIAATGQLYRLFLPIPVWVAFYNQKEFGHFFKMLVLGLYLVIKFLRMAQKSRQFASLAYSFLMRDLPYGRLPNPDEVRQAGDLCAVCQEKFKNPVALPCNHIFCDDCISQWFARNNSCPLCRSVVRSAGNGAYGDGSTTLLLTVF